MPIFHVKIVLADGRRLSEFREVPDAGLEEYYTETYANAIKLFGAALADFDLTQISLQSKAAKELRTYKTATVQRSKGRNRRVQIKQ